MAGFMTFLVLAFLVEVVTNLGKNYVKVLKPYTPWVAGVLGILLCIFTEASLFDANGISAAWAYADYGASGIIVARLAGIINDLSKKLG